MVVQNGDPKEGERVGPRKVVIIGMPIEDVVDLLVFPIEMALDVSGVYEKIRAVKLGEDERDGMMMGATAGQLEGLLKVVRDESEDAEKRVHTLKALLEVHEVSQKVVSIFMGIVKQAAAEEEAERGEG